MLSYHDYIRPTVRAIACILASFATGFGLALWLNPSPLVALIVLTVVWGAILCHSWGLPWLDRLQQRRWLAYWREIDAVTGCDFDCTPAHCAALQAQCALHGQHREGEQS